MDDRDGMEGGEPHLFPISHDIDLAVAIKPKRLVVLVQLVG